MTMNLYVSLMYLADSIGWNWKICWHVRFCRFWSYFIIFAFQLLSSEPLKFAVWFSPHKAHFTSLQFCFKGYLDEQWPPAHLTQIGCTLPKFLVWPYFWQLMHCGNDFFLFLFKNPSIAIDLEIIASIWSCNDVYGPESRQGLW